MKKIHQEITSYKGVVNKPQLSWEPKLTNPTMMVNKVKEHKQSNSINFYIISEKNKTPCKEKERTWIAKPNTGYEKKRQEFQNKLHDKGLSMLGKL
jgi:predicted ATP-grasp superfamily ATP-dependent carboligase